MFKLHTSKSMRKCLKTAAYPPNYSYVHRKTMEKRWLWFNEWVWRYSVGQTHVSWPRPSNFRPSMAASFPCCTTVAWPPVGSCKSFSGSALAFLRISWRLRDGRSRVWVGLKRRCTPKKEPVVMGTWSWTIWKTIRCRGTYFQTNLQMDVYWSNLLKLWYTAKIIPGALSPNQTPIYRCQGLICSFIPRRTRKISRTTCETVLLETWWSIVFQ